jgi:hypothetical protein
VSGALDTPEKTTTSPTDMVVSANQKKTEHQTKNDSMEGGEGRGGEGRGGEGRRGGVGREGGEARGWEGRREAW